MRESDLYPPLKRFLESRGYEVKGEVEGCDAVAVRGDEPPVVVELKLSLNLDLVLQAVSRLDLAPAVYIGVPSRCGLLKRRRRQVVKLLRMLGLGLVVIDPGARRGGVTVLLDPGAYRPRESRRRRERLLGEFAARVGDPVPGGQDRRRGLMTAYRQRALAVACLLRDCGATKASVVASRLDEPEARHIMYRNVYGWFERVSTGVYDLSPRGRTEAPRWMGESTDGGDDRREG